MAKGKTDFIIIGLNISGWKEGTSAARARVFEHPSEKMKLFVGNAASVRRGRNKTDSKPVNEAFKNELVKLGEDFCNELTKEKRQQIKEWLDGMD